MHAAKIAVTIPEDHQLTIALPGDLPPGPAEIIVLVAARQADATQVAPRRKRSPIGWLANEPELADAIQESGTAGRKSDTMRTFDDEDPR